jgi:hypothetical protein
MSGPHAHPRRNSRRSAAQRIFSLIPSVQVFIAKYSDEAEHAQ